MRVASLFSGIGGFELGLKAIDASPILMCENDPAARSVLQTHFEGVPIVDDVREVCSLPDSDLLVAGWPCQDLSQAGRTSGLSGSRSSLVEDVFRLIEASPSRPDFVLLENVAFALSLKGGESLKFATSELERLGYNWAFRILDSNFFGLPQRRRRLFILGSRRTNPEAILFDGFASKIEHAEEIRHVGFYWTEGNRGIGWTPNAIPPLKGGSNLSIPSPPAIWEKQTGEFYVPGITDAERLQGFSPNWTSLQEVQDRKSTGHRWRQVGNAVSVNVVNWVAERLQCPTQADVGYPTSDQLKGANAGWGGPTRSAKYLSKLWEGPIGATSATLFDFGLTETKPLSYRAASGFLRRYLAGSLRKNEAFAQALESYCSRVRSDKVRVSHAA